MIIDCIADLHGYYPKLASGDLLIVAGDLTSRHTEEQHFEFNKWLEEQKYTHIIMIAGNHDTWIQDNDCAGFNDYDGQKVEYLCDSGKDLIIHGNLVKIWGTPWTKKFDEMNPKCMAFTYDTEEKLASKFSLIPDDIDILISHGPMKHILDGNIDGYACGSSSLRDAVDRVKPRLHVFGHIHEQGGNQLMYKHQGLNTWCVNCSYVNEKYKPVNKPVRVIL